MLYYHTHHTNVNIKEGKAINWFCRWKKKCLVYNILKLLIYTHRLYNIIYYPIFFLDESCCRTLYIYKVDFFFSHFPINHTRASLQIEIFRMYVVGSWEYVYPWVAVRPMVFLCWLVGWFQHSQHSTARHTFCKISILRIKKKSTTWNVINNK